MNRTNRQDLRYRHQATLPTDETMAGRHGCCLSSHRGGFWHSDGGKIERRPVIRRFRSWKKIGRPGQGNCW